MKEEIKEKEHEFVHASKSGLALGTTYILIYCKKCGQVSFDQSKNGKLEITKCN